MKPSVGVAVRLAVEGGGFTIEQCDDRVAVAVEAAERRDERFRQPGVEGLYDPVEELVATVVAGDGPGDVGRQQGKGASCARTPDVECG
jgi:hypothetical protein